MYFRSAKNERKKYVCVSTITYMNEYIVHEQYVFIKYSESKRIDKLY